LVSLSALFFSTRACHFLFPIFLLAAPVRADIERATIDHDYVRNLAEKLAEKPYRERKADLPAFFRDMTYDDYARIRFIPENSLWLGDNLPFIMQFFHPGGLHKKPVVLHEFSDTHVQRIPFLRTYFDYQDLNAPARIPGSLDYAGFRILSHINAPDRWDEDVSFLGASYFRALAKDQRYGISARGLAINSGGAEEFPDFVSFWIGKPTGNATSVTIHALLDSPSVAGAYTFVMTPGVETIIDAHASLFFRATVSNLGLAPLTSMFWFGENSADHHGDFRQEVHDSDGLLVAPDAATRLWRPLTNPPQLRVTDFNAAAPVGFGVLQRDRIFRDYEDTEARYERRPSVWIEPSGGWPPGRVRLVELTAINEYNDNVVAFWSPLEQPAAGSQLEFAYRMHWTNEATFGGPPAWVRATRQTVQVERPKRTKYVIDFDGPGVTSLASDAAITAEVTTGPQVAILDQRLFRNDIDGSWRLAVLLDAPAADTPQEIRARLVSEGKPISETWVSTWQP
jgi:glucans biosynthesis protein